MNKYIKDVQEFHEYFEHPINDKKDDIGLSTRQLRTKLIFEELEELAEANGTLNTFINLCFETINKNNTVKVKDSDNVDKVEELDALCDIQYVLSGGVLALGHQGNFDDAFQDVQNSNMSKACSNMKEVEDTIEMYVGRGMSIGNISYKEKNGIYIVYRVEDGKILKNKYYKPTNLKQFV